MHPEDLASLISFHRKRANLTQTELAEHAGVSRYVVQDLEAGNGRTTWQRMMAVLNVINLKLEPSGPLVEEWKNLCATNDDE